MKRNRQLSHIQLLQEKALPAVRHFLGVHRPFRAYAMHLQGTCHDTSIRLEFEPRAVSADVTGRGTLVIDAAPETLAFSAQFVGAVGQQPFAYFLPPIAQSDVGREAIIDRIQYFVEDGIDYFRLMPPELDNMRPPYGQVLQWCLPSRNFLCRPPFG